MYTTTKSVKSYIGKEVNRITDKLEFEMKSDRLTLNEWLAKSRVLDGLIFNHFLDGDNEVISTKNFKRMENKNV